MAYFHVSVEEKIAVLALENPPANALGISVLEELSQRLDEYETREDIRVVIIRGEGKFFSAGANIKEFTMMKDRGTAVHMALNGQKLFERIENYSKPIIAAVHGLALGGGLELALACHMRVIAKGTKLGLPELTLGIIPGYGGTQRLTRFVGFAKASEMILTSEPISAEEAHHFGLANHVVEPEELLTKTLDIAKKIAEKSPVVIKASLEAMRSYKTKSYHEGLELEANQFGNVFESLDCKEGIMAFIEKRKPNFQGK